MVQSKLDALLEELEDVESLLELDALVGDLEGDASTLCYAEHPSVVAKVAALRGTLRSTVAEEHVDVEVAERPTVVRVGRKYKLLKTDVGWCTKPQVHAIMSILSAHASIGDIIDEADIVRMMEANKHVLGTRQEPSRVWDYYKGNSGDGLVAHSNLERI